MATPINWLDWLATQVAIRRVRISFGLTPLGQRALADATATAAPRSAPAATASQRCVWCDQPIEDGQPTTEIGGHLLHDEPCLDEFRDVMEAPACVPCHTRGTGGSARRSS